MTHFERQHLKLRHLHRQLIAASLKGIRRRTLDRLRNRINALTYRLEN